MSSRSEIRFRVGISLDYPHYVSRGALSRVGSILETFVPLERPVAVVGDETVLELFGETLIRSLRDAGRSVMTVQAIPPGETSKSVPVWSDLVDRLLGAGLHRRAVLLALGGGWCPTPWGLWLRPTCAASTTSIFPPV